MEQLRKERALYDEYCQLEKEAEHLLRLYQAWQLCIAQGDTIASKSAMEKGQAKIKQIEDKIQQNRDLIKTTDTEIEEAHKNANAVCMLLKFFACFH